MISRLPSRSPAFLLALTLLPGVAYGQSASPTISQKAQKLFQEAVEELDNAEYATACPKLEEVTRLVPEGAGARATLAECYERQGKLASAWKQYTAAEALMKKQNKPDRAMEAGRQAAALKPRLASVVITLASKVSGLSVQIDGEPVEESQLDTGVFADVGGHEVVASAPGHEPFSTTVTVPKDGAQVRVAIPALQPKSSAGGGPATSPTGDAPSPPAGKSASPSFQLIGGVAGLGLGAVSVAVGVVSSLQVAEAQSALDEHRHLVSPDQQLCDPDIQAGLQPDTRKQVTDACGREAFVPLQFVFYGLGAALAGTGAYLLATSRSGAPQTSTWWIQPAVGANGATLGVGGTW